jgi:HK97 family phage major capsid protein
MDMTKAAILELGDLQRRAAILARGDAKDRAESNVLQAQMKNIRELGLSSLEMGGEYAIAKTDALSRSLRGRATNYTQHDVERRTALFNKWLTSKDKSVEAELRATDMLGRPTGVSYVGGSGYLVPPAFSSLFFAGLAQVDPLLDADNVTLEVTDGYSFAGEQIPSWDLSSFSAVRVGAGASDGEAIQQTAQTVPTTAANTLSGYVYKCTLSVAMELFDDVSEAYLNDKLSTAFSIGMGRGVGVDLVLGTGGSMMQPSGLLPFAYNTGLTIGTGSEQAGNQPSGNFTAQDLTRLYFSLNRAWRASPRCAFVCADETYQQIRLATDNFGRPLLNVTDDGERLFGKKVLVAPSVPYANGSPIVQGKIIFGDLSRFVVRCTTLAIQKSMENVSAIEKGEYDMIGRLRCDAAIIDPTGGTANSPIVFASTN